MLFLKTTITSEEKRVMKNKKAPGREAQFQGASRSIQDTETASWRLELFFILFFYSHLDT